MQVHVLFSEEGAGCVPGVMQPGVLGDARFGQECFPLLPVVVRVDRNRRHMIGDHHDRSAGRATLLVRTADGILGTHICVLSYRVTLGVPLQLAAFVSGLLAAHRREIGTRTGTRARTCWKQAVFVLAWFCDRPDIRRLGRGFGISQATACRYVNEAIDVLAARAPSLCQALEKARELGLAYLILDGTIVGSDRCAEKATSRKGRAIDRWYSGKAHHPGGNIQALSVPRGVPLWVSDVLPGSTHDLTAARQHVLPRCGRT